MRERVLFIGAAKERRVPFRSLCAAFGIAPKTGYKWWNQFPRSGVDGLAEKSRRPHSNRLAMSDALADRIVRLRKKRPTWGPRKLVHWLEQNEISWTLPAPSTVGDLLKRRGLIFEPREHRRERRVPRTAPLSDAIAPNSVWSMDFKGWFRLADRMRVDPLTITDNYSRYSLCCCALEKQTCELTWKCLARTFLEFGLPDAMRVDNGQPWTAPKGQLNLTVLSANILRLGIVLERIGRGKPQENGRHERFHLTLQNETVFPLAANIRAQQRRFDRHRKDFNEERPHDAVVCSRPPASIYTASRKKFPERLPEPQHPSNCDTHRIDAAGFVRFAGERYFVSTALRGLHVGIYEAQEGCFETWFCSELLGHVVARHPELGLIANRKVLPMSPV